MNSSRENYCRTRCCRLMCQFTNIYTLPFHMCHHQGNQYYQTQYYKYLHLTVPCVATKETSIIRLNITNIYTLPFHMCHHQGNQYYQTQYYKYLHLTVPCVATKETSIIRHNICTLHLQRHSVLFYTKH